MVNEPPEEAIADPVCKTTTSHVANLIPHHLDVSWHTEDMQVLLYYTAREVPKGSELTVCYGSEGPKGGRGDHGRRGIPPQGNGMEDVRLTEAF